MERATEAVVRPAEDADLAAIAAIYGVYVESSAASFEEVPPSPEDLRERRATGRRMPWLVAEAPGGGVLGFAFAYPHHSRPAYRWSVSCSVYLHESARGRGVATALYRPLLDVLRDLGYVSAYAGIALPNDASVALHERFGFRHVGTFPVSGYKLGAWRDVGWWWLALRDPPHPPDEPRPWTGLVD